MPRPPASPGRIRSSLRRLVLDLQSSRIDIPQVYTRLLDFTERYDIKLKNYFVTIKIEALKPFLPHGPSDAF